MSSSKLCILLVLVNAITLSAAIGFAVYKDKATRPVEEGIVSPHRDGSAEDSFRTRVSQPNKLPGRLGDVLVKIFKERITIADLCKDKDIKAEVLQKLRNDTTYECVLNVFTEGVPVNSMDLVKALCLHPRKNENCYEAGLGPIVRRCLSDGATQGHESLMFLWEKAGNAICHTLFGDEREALQNSVVKSCFRSQGHLITRCLARFVMDNRDLPRLTPDSARETAPHRCRNMVRLMYCVVSVLEGCNDPKLSLFAKTVFYKTFEYTTCNTTDAVIDAPANPDVLASSYVGSLPEGSPLNILVEVVRFIGQMDYKEEESFPNETDTNSDVAQLSYLPDFEKIGKFLGLFPSKEDVLNTEAGSNEIDRSSDEVDRSSDEIDRSSDEIDRSSDEIDRSSDEIDRRSDIDSSSGEINSRDDEIDLSSHKIEPRSVDSAENVENSAEAQQISLGDILTGKGFTSPPLDLLNDTVEGSTNSTSQGSDVKSEQGKNSH